MPFVVFSTFVLLNSFLTSGSFEFYSGSFEFAKGSFLTRDGDSPQPWGMYFLSRLVSLVFVFHFVFVSLAIAFAIAFVYLAFA
jgi:hypothetical protein